ncbi:dimethylsulfonioproprionate lyase family protein [Roseibium sp. M-1]
MTVLPDEISPGGDAATAAEELAATGSGPLGGTAAWQMPGALEIHPEPAEETGLADLVLGDCAQEDILVDLAAESFADPRRAAFDRLLETLQRLYAETEAMRDFAPWPDNLVWSEREPVALPVAGHVGGWDETSDGTAASSVHNDVHKAMAEAAAHAEWRLTYTEEQVGAHFLENYGYFELFGPDGHYRTSEARAYVAYWGPWLFYDWHHHEAEELYVIVSGSGLFHLEGGADGLLKRGDTRLHGSWQKHAMTTGDEPILTFVMWRGAGLEGLPKMGKG